MSRWAERVPAYCISGDLCPNCGQLDLPGQHSAEERRKLPPVCDVARPSRYSAQTAIFAPTRAGPRLPPDHGSLDSGYFVFTFPRRRRRRPPSGCIESASSKWMSSQPGRLLSLFGVYSVFFRYLLAQYCYCDLAADPSSNGRTH
jgi:hypothetical protein